MAWKMKGSLRRAVQRTRELVGLDWTSANDVRRKVDPAYDLETEEQLEHRLRITRELLWEPDPNEDAPPPTSLRRACLVYGHLKIGERCLRCLEKVE